MHKFVEADSTNLSEVKKALGRKTPNVVYADTLFGTGKIREINGVTYDDSKSRAHNFTEKMITNMHSVLPENGTFWLHCDPYSNYLYREMLNDIFGASNYLNEVIWAYASGGRPHRKMASKHDVIFWYAKNATSDYTYNIVREPYRSLKPGEQRKGFHKDGKPITSVWTDIGIMSTTSNERVDWPTQKPLKLIDRIILLSTNQDDLILDPCAGSGTTVVAAQRNNRKAIGLDVSPIAIATASARLD